MSALGDPESPADATGDLEAGVLGVRMIFSFRKMAANEGVVGVRP
jgi:hypothetical protein